MTFPIGEILIIIGPFVVVGIIILVLSLLLGWRKSKFLAYLLWFLGGLGTLGLHRFYIGKIGSGFLWLFTGGIFGIGALVDLFILGSLVEVKQMRTEMRSRRG